MGDGGTARCPRPDCAYLGVDRHGAGVPGSTLARPRPPLAGAPLGVDGRANPVVSMLSRHLALGLVDGLGFDPGINPAWNVS
jgi:hypothetical protein